VTFSLTGRALLAKGRPAAAPHSVRGS
jgi:hypothetical protein